MVPMDQEPKVLQVPMPQDHSIKLELSAKDSLRRNLIVWLNIKETPKLGLMIVTQIEM